MERGPMNLDALETRDPGYRLFFEGGADGMLLVTGDREILDANQRACGLLHRSREDLMGMRIDALSDPSYPILEPAWEELRAKGSFRGAVRLMRADASSFPAEVSIMGDGGGRIGIFFREIERREEGEAPRASAAEYRALVEDSADAMAVFGPDNTFRYANPSFERLLGYKPEELIGLFVPDIAHPEDLARGAAVMAGVQNGSGGPERIPGEFRYRHKEGHWVYLETTFNNLMENPEVHGFVVICRDVTERVEAEERLKESEESYRALAENALDFVLVQKPDNTLSYVSPSIKRLLGYEPEEAIGRVGAEFIHPEDLERAWPLFYKQLQTPGINEGVVIRYRHKDGSWRWFESACNNQLDNPAVRGLVFNCRDVTERIEAEEEVRRLNRDLEKRVAERTAELERVLAEVAANEKRLHESEQQFRATFEQAAVGVAQVSLDGRWLKVNRKLCEIVGYSRAELMEKDFQSITHPEDLEADLEQFKRMLTGEIDTYFIEKRYITKGGSEVWIHLTVSLVREPSGDPRYFVSVVEDITERVRAEEALRQSEEIHRTVVEQAAENIFVVDPRTKRVLEANAALRASLGYGAEEVRDLTLYDFVVLDRESIDESVRRIAEGSKFAGERRYRCKDGTLMDVEVSASAIPYNGGAALCIVAHDITERKNAEKRLRHALDVLLALYEAGHVLGSTLDLDEVGPGLLEIMQRVSNLSAAVLLVRDETRQWHPWHTIGSEDLWRSARRTPEAVAARFMALKNEEPRTFKMQRSSEMGEPLVGLCLPLRMRDRVVGVLEAYGPRDLIGEETIEVLGSLASQAASALENARLYEELIERESRLHDLVGRMLGAQEEERRRVAYEVHDGLAQVAAAAHQRLQAFADRHFLEDERGREDLNRVVGLVQQTVNDARRIIADLRPTELDDLGLAAAVRLQVEKLREEGFSVYYEEALGTRRLTTTIEIALYRVVQEALTNFRKHAGTDRVRLEISRKGGAVVLEVRDEGRGFDPNSVGGSGPGERVGFSGMRERVNALGGELTIRSRPRAGTSISVEVPLPVAFVEDCEGERGHGR